MKLFQVRKGQFVYYQKELYKVYSVKYMLRQSIHLVRLRDLEQELCQAADIKRYTPKHMDSFQFNRRRFTLHEKARASEGDYILIHRPTPDTMDHYFLNEIEKVATVEEHGVVTSRSNGVEHHEYMLMVPGREEGSRTIDYEDRDDPDDGQPVGNESVVNTASVKTQPPIIGDVYEQVTSSHVRVAMVVAVDYQTIMMGDGQRVSEADLADPNQWIFKYHVIDR